jgi:hypothetical protein
MISGFGAAAVDDVDLLLQRFLDRGAVGRVLGERHIDGDALVVELAVDEVGGRGRRLRQ